MTRLICFRSFAVLPLILIMTLALPPATSRADEKEKPPPKSRVAVTVEVPAGLASFDDTAIVCILFEYDPRLADAAATEVDRVVVRNLGHQKGIEQTLRFNIGEELGVILNDRRYYISCRIYQDLGDETFKRGKQVHYCHNEHDSLPGTVYDKVNGTKLIFVAR